MESLGGMLGGGASGATSAVGTGAGAAGQTALGGGALGTQGAAMTTANGGFAGTGGVTGAVSNAMPYIQGAQQVMNMIGPQGSLTKGNPASILSDVQGLNNSYDNIFKSPLTSAGVKGSAEVLGRGTTDSFKDLPGDIQKEVLKILTMGK